MTVETRKQKISQAKVISLVGKHGYITDYEVNGEYHVYIPEKPEKYQGYTLTGQKVTYFVYRPTCHSKADPKKFSVCKGNSNGAVCYHCLAAIKNRVRVAGKVLSLPKDGEFASAIKLLNFGGQLIKITNQNGRSVWGVVR